MQRGNMNKEKEITESKISEMMAKEYANVESEFCWLPYACADTEVDDRRCILPPVTKSEKTGHAIAHAVVCAVEARYHNARRRCYPPKRMWRCSVKSLIQTMTRRTNQEGYWSIKSISEAISEFGIGLTVDENTSDHPEQLGPGPKYRGVYLERLNLAYEVVCHEIVVNGPIIALITPLKEDFEDWSSELAKERVYSGISRDTRSAVALIGDGRFNDGSVYFIARNCLGEQWGDEGVFRILPKVIVSVFRPVLPFSK